MTLGRRVRCKVRVIQFQVVFPLLGREILHGNRFERVTDGLVLVCFSILFSILENSVGRRQKL